MVNSADVATPNSPTGSVYVRVCGSTFESGGTGERESGDADDVLGVGENGDAENDQEVEQEEDRVIITEVAPMAAAAEFYLGNYDRMAKYVDIYHGKGALLHDPDFLEGKVAAVEAVQKLLASGSRNENEAGAYGGTNALAAARRTYDMLFYSAVFAVSKGRYEA